MGDSLRNRNLIMLAYKLFNRQYPDFVSTRYQAEDIQRAVGIEKFSYEFLATQIGIEADEAGEGQGHYSFYKLLLFGFAHYASQLGLSPNAVRMMIDFFNNVDKKTKREIFDPYSITNSSLYFIISEDRRYYAIRLKDRKGKKKNISYCNGAIVKFYRHAINGINEVGDIYRDLENTEGFVTINLGLIKRNIISSLT